MLNKYKFFSIVALASLMIVAGTSCLKDKLADDNLTNPEIEGSPSVIEIMGPGRWTTSYNSSYAISLIASTKDTTFNMVYIRLASEDPAPEDIKVQLELVPTLLNGYNDSNGTHLVQPSANLYQLADNMVVTIPKGSREGTLKMTAKPKELEGAEYGFGVRVKSVTPSNYTVSGNFSNAVVIVGIRNIYDGIYDYKGFSLRAGDPALTGYFNGAEMGLETTGPNSVIFTGLAVWGDGTSGIGIGNPELQVNTTTNKVTISSSGGAGNAPGYDSRYDPATKTFYISFTWGAGPAARLSTDTLTYTGPRP